MLKDKYMTKKAQLKEAKASLSAMTDCALDAHGSLPFHIYQDNFWNL